MLSDGLCRGQGGTARGDSVGVPAGAVLAFVPEDELPFQGDAQVEMVIRGQEVELLVLRGGREAVRAERSREEDQRRRIADVVPVRVLRGVDDRRPIRRQASCRRSARSLHVVLGVERESGAERGIRFEVLDHHA